MTTLYKRPFRNRLSGVQLGSGFALLQIERIEAFREPSADRRDFAFSQSRPWLLIALRAKRAKEPLRLFNLGHF